MPITPKVAAEMSKEEMEIVTSLYDEIDIQLAENYEGIHPYTYPLVDGIPQRIINYVMRAYTNNGWTVHHTKLNTLVFSED